MNGEPGNAIEWAAMPNVNTGTITFMFREGARTWQVSLPAAPVLEAAEQAKFAARMVSLGYPVPAPMMVTGACTDPAQVVVLDRGRAMWTRNPAAPATPPGVADVVDLNDKTRGRRR